MDRSEVLQLVRVGVGNVMEVHNQLLTVGVVRDVDRRAVVHHD